MKKGIDVSYCQGNIDFNKIDKNQVQFVIIRSSFGWEANQKDNCFERNYEGFKRLKIPVGAYHYSYAKTAEQAVKEAKYCLECIKGKSFELPVFIDMEEASQAAVGRRTCTDIAKAFIQTMEKAGYRSGIYTNPNWLENYLYKGEIVGKVNLWLAQWGSSKPYCDCMLWQYNVGKSGTVSGISGKIDLDYCYSGIEAGNGTSSSTGSGTAAGTLAVGVPDIYYQVFAGGRWLPYVKNLSDYAGLSGKPIVGMMAKVTKGHIKYRVHIIGGGWLPWVTDLEDFAGSIRLTSQIDCVQMELVGLTGYTVKYRVKCTGRAAYLPYVTGWNSNNSNGYAGIYGAAIDRLQAIIVKK